MSRRGRGTYDPRCLPVVGAELLARTAVDGLRRVLSLERLEPLIGFSRQTIWRHIPKQRSKAERTDAAGKVVEAIAASLCDMEAMAVRDNVHQGMALYNAAMKQGVSLEAFYNAAFLKNFTDSFRGSGFVAGMLIHAAAASASPVYDAGPPRSEADQKLAHTLLALRRDFYRQMTDDFVDLLVLAMQESGRRPKHPFSSTDICIAIHALHDGLVQRRLLDPDSVHPDFAARALTAIAFAMTEEGRLAGVLDDPRAPTHPEQKPRYQSLVEATIKAYSVSSSPLDVEILKLAGESVQVLNYLFESRTDLLDSSLRGLLGGVSEAVQSIGPDYPNLFVAEVLKCIADAAQLNRNLFAAAGEHPTLRRDNYVVAQLVGSIARCLSLDPTANAHALAENLVDFAMKGDVNAVNALLQAARLEPIPRPTTGSASAPDGTDD